MTVGEGLKLFWGRERVEGLTGAAEMKANGEKVKLAGDMGGGEEKMGPEGLNVKRQRLKLCCVRVGRDGAGAQGRERKIRRRHKGGRRQKGNRRTVGQWGKSETGWGQS